MGPGVVVDDRFEVEGLARAGGMGSVFRARDRVTGERVALKIAHPDAMAYAERFAREAAVLSELRHPGIVRYVAHGRTASGDMYLAMEWLEGEDLSERLARVGLTAEESLMLVRGVADTLTAPHRRGLVHRDLKPSNLFLVGSATPDAVKVLDFGIVRVSGEPDRSTQTGMVLGTIGYMAPEQARGGDVDARADVFALGCVLFECLTGRPAFTGRDVLAVQAKILLEEAPRVDELRDDVSISLCDLVARMLAKDPKERPPDAAAVVRELDGLGRSADDAQARLRRSERPLPGLTTGEQRLLCVVMLSPTRTPPVREDSAPTLASEAHGGSILAMREAARAYGGRLEAIANGSVVVTLDGTTAATDQAARAARCAIALRAIVRSVPMALATGRGDATTRWPVGEVIDRAVQVLRLAEARTPSDRRDERESLPIELDELTAGLLDERFEVRASQLRGFREASGGSRTLLGKPTPFVGRTRELGVLEAIYDECVADGVAQAVLVEGAPGVGKTRLAWEFSRRLLTRPAYAREPVETSVEISVEIFWGSGDPMSVGSPFAILTQAIRRGMGLEQGEPISVQQAKLRARLARSFSGKDLERVTEFLGELVSVPVTGEASLQLRAARQEPILMGDQMRRAFEDWLAAEAGKRPVVLVLEDLHWGDLPTVQFVDGALRHLTQVDGGRPLMVLALARPEVHASFPTLWHERTVTRMELGELGRKPSERLVRHVLGDALPDSSVHRLVEHAAGNAFYLEEVIRAAADGKDSVLPPTVLAMVHVRLESLPAEARRVLRAASVFGQAFWRDGVEALLRDHTETEIAEVLEELENRELVHRVAPLAPAAETPEPALANLGEPEYMFRHALVREAAYAMLTERDRSLGHKLAGEWLESRLLARVNARDDLAVALAEHFERGGLPERAARWFRRAAEQALEGNDFAAVVARAERGISCGEKLESLGPLRLLQAEGYRWRGQLVDAEKYALDALNSLPEDSPRWYDAAGELAVASSLRGDNDRLVEVGELLAKIPLRTDMLSAQIVAWSRTATWLLLAGFLAVGEALVRRIDEAAALLPGPDPAVTARVHYTQATRALVAGDTSAYLHLSEAAAIDFDHAGILRSLCVQRRNVGIARIQLGLYEDAVTVLRSVLDDARRMHIGTLAAEVDHWLGFALARMGRLEEARAIQERSVAEALEHGSRWIEARARAVLATILARMGELDLAEEQARIAAESAANTPSVKAVCLATIAQLHLARGDADQALGCAREAMSVLATVGGMEDGEALIRLVHAEALRAAGDALGARDAILEARTRLLQRAVRIGDAQMRASFLENVAEHARTLELGRHESGSIPPGR